VRRVILVLFLAILFFPLYWMAVGSISNGASMSKMPPSFFPAEPTVGAYQYLLGAKDLLLWIANTVILLCFGTTVSVVAAVAAGFALSIRPRGWRVVVGLLLAGLLVPRAALTIPLFVEVTKLGLTGTLAGAALPLVYFPTGTLLAMGYFRGIPKELFEEAAMVGSTDLDVLRHIAIPNAGPVVGLLMLMKSVEASADYLWQSLMLRSPRTFTYIVGIMDRATDSPLITKNTQGSECASAILIFLPFVILYLFTSRYFTQDPLKGLR
jgi:multiple sugar transport system permease protein